MAQRGGPGATTRKRGHQHHPLNTGSRRRDVLLASEIPNDRNVTSPPARPKAAASCDAKSDESAPRRRPKENLSLNLTPTVIEKSASKSDIIDLTTPEEELSSKQAKEKLNEAIHYMSLVERPEAEGSSQSDQEAEDAEAEELSRLRCPSERTEVLAERETRRRKRRCADYPGLAFGSSIFSSDTLMKFSIIRNELHNIMNTQLKRVGPHFYLFLIAAKLLT